MARDGLTGGRSDGRPARRLLAGLALLGLAAGLFACSDDGDPPEPDRTTTTRDPDEVVDGGTIRLGLAGPLVVDPAEANPASPSELMVLDLLHDGLTRAGPDGAVEPALATSWEHDGAFTTWTFHLDPGATFTSGKPLTSAEVVASLDRVAAQGRTSLAALRLEHVAGFAEVAAGAAPHLSGLAAPDASTVQITTTTPLAVLPAILAGPEMGVVDPAALAAATGDDGDLADLDLSGGWSVDEADGDAVALVRRPDRPGHLDGVELVTYEDQDEAFDAFEDDDVDWALIPPERYEDAVEDHGDDHVTPFQAEVFLGLRVASPDLARPELRTAIAQAIDRAALVDAVYSGRAEALQTIVPRGVPGHDADLCDSAACQYDPAAAKATVAAAFPDGNVPSVAIDFDDSPIQQSLAEAVAEDLEAAGIPTELRPKPLQEYKAFVTTGTQELFSFGWIGGYASPDAYLAPLFGSVMDDNLTGYGSAEVDQALAAARQTDDEAAAAGHWADVERRILAEAVVVPLAQFRTQAVVGEQVRALEHAVDGTVDWSEVWLAG